jgi:hypothetical protein
MLVTMNHAVYYYILLYYFINDKVRETFKQPVTDCFFSYLEDIWIFPKLNY